MNVSNMRGSGSRRVVSPGGWSGSQYDMMSYQEAARSGQIQDTPLNKIQHKFWVTKQAVARKLGKEEDQHVVASDCELDAKLELFRSIYETTCRLQRLMEIYQDRICFLAGEENGLGRFLKEHGKSDKTRAGKMMVAAGKTMSYTGQQRLAIRVPLLRLYQEVDTFRLRAIEDTRWTLENMEKARTDYRGALMWMKNVSTELDPDTFKQLEKFRKVQAHVKTSKARFDKLKLDCVQKIDLLAASRCNMFSHALIMYQNTMVTFWDKTSKTMNHVNNGFKGYQYYEFNYIKDLASTSKKLAGEEKDKDTSTPASFPKDTDQQLVNLGADSSALQPQKPKDSGSLHNLLDLDQSSAIGPVPSLDDDDEILLRIDSELGTEGMESRAMMGSVEDIFQQRRVGDSLSGGQDDEVWPGQDARNSEKMLDQLLDTTEPAEGGFTAEWENAFRREAELPTDDFSDFMGVGASRELAWAEKAKKSFLPSQLFDLSNLSLEPSTKPHPQIQASLAGEAPSRPKGQKSSEMSEWFSLFADLDPLANPDSVGRSQGQGDGGC